jgi:hypothetical protein
MKKFLIILILTVGIYEFVSDVYNVSDPSKYESIATKKIHDNNEPENTLANDHSTEILENAFKNRRSDIQVTGSGIVIKVLSDDNRGSRHQRFIIRLSSGQTLLVAYNIDLAPRIHTLSKGDEVEFYGEYEWSHQGGVIHWTHRDPKGYHADGWLKHHGKTYQ